MTYYEVATNTRGRVDLCTGRLQPRWRRAVHTGILCREVRCEANPDASNAAANAVAKITD